MLPQLNASDSLQIRKVTFYSATEVTLREGDAMSYDNDDTNAPVTSTTVAEKNLRGRRVVAPATANLGGFAGLVAPSSAGVVAAAGVPTPIDIIVPRRGDVCYGYTNVNCTKNSTVLGITNAGGRILVSHADATLNVDMVGICLQTVDRSSTNGTVLLKFL